MRTVAYAPKSLVASVTFLCLAFLSKGYSGPYQWFAEAYLGDVFIVGCLYFALSLVAPEKSGLFKFIAIGLFAVVVEFFQATGLPAALNLPEPFVFVLGTSFDVFDFVSYFIGLLLAVFVDRVIYRKSVF